MVVKERARAGRPVGVEAVTPESQAVFIEWALRHGAEHDDSYTQGPDLELFPTPGEIAALAVRDGRPVGAASLMIDGFVESGLGRFRILHAARSEAYEPLVEWIVARIPPGVHDIFCFLPDQAAAGDTLACLGFAPTRHAVILERASEPVSKAVVPADTEIRPATPADAVAWTEVVNAAFAGDPGRYSMTEQRAVRLLRDERVLASFLAWRGGEPVGLSTVDTVWRDEEEEEPPSAEITTLAVVPRAQGQGLGRALLRRALTSAADAGLCSTSLSTSSVNEPALGLYISEGFGVVEKRVCWGRSLSEDPSRHQAPVGVSGTGIDQNARR